MLWPLAFITPPKGEMKGAFVVILSPSRGNFLGSRDSLIPQKKGTHANGCLFLSEIS